MICWSCFNLCHPSSNVPKKGLTGMFVDKSVEQAKGSQTPNLKDTKNDNRGERLPEEVSDNRRPSFMHKSFQKTMETSGFPVEYHNLPAVCTPVNT